MLFGLMRQKVFSSGFTSSVILGRKSMERSLPAATSYSIVRAYYGRLAVGRITFQSSTKKSVFPVSGVSVAASGVPVVGRVTFGPSVQLRKWRREKLNSAARSAGINFNTEHLFRELKLFRELQKVADFDMMLIGKALRYLVHHSDEASSFLAIPMEEKKTFLMKLFPGKK